MLAHRIIFIASGVAIGIAMGCSVGAGDGAVMGTVTSEECGLDHEPFNLKPSFFAAQPIEEMLEIRIQRNSDFEDKSDGINLFVRDADLIQRERLEQPIDLAAVNAVVTMNLYLNHSCKVDRRSTPFNLNARAGTITFHQIYAPQVSRKQIETDAEFADVLFEDPYKPEERNAVLSGHFRFLFNRGRPAQRFP